MGDLKNDKVIQDECKTFFTVASTATYLNNDTKNILNNVADRDPFTEHDASFAPTGETGDLTGTVRIVLVYPGPASSA